MTTTPSTGVGVTEGDSAKHSKHVRKKLLMSLFVLLMLCALSVAGWLFGRAGRVLCVCIDLGLLFACRHRRLLSGRIWCGLARIRISYLFGSICQRTHF